MSINLSPLATAVIYADDSPYHQLQKKLYDIDIDYFEKIPAWTERIPSRLDFKLKSDIVADFNKLADQLLNQEIKNRLIQELNLGNITATEKEMNDAFESLKGMAPLYFNKTKPCPQVEEKELRKLYRKAKRRSFWERIFRTNGSDVFDFHQALMHRTVWECKELIENRSLQFVKEVMLATVKQ
jgi:hypothetical protein